MDGRNDSIERIRRKLGELQDADPKLWGFGATDHQYRLVPALDDAEVDRICDHFGIVLPDDYRLFITTLGNGGVGPGYGLQRFGYVARTAEIPDATPKGPDRLVYQKPGRRYFTKDLFDDTGRKVDRFDVAFFDSIKRLTGDGCTGPSAPSREFPLMEPFRAETNADEIEWERIPGSDGVFLLVDYGCCIRAHLVLNGPYAGEVWIYDPTPGYYVPFCEMAMIHHVDDEDLHEDERERTFSFLEWYEHWLDHALIEIREEYRVAAARNDAD